MQKNKIVVSIIIVHYKTKNDLFNCIDSVYASRPKALLEIIVVDNDEVKTIEKELKMKFPKVRYVQNPVNNGWGSGTNVGAAYAHGAYIYFLNPDCIIYKHTIDILVEFIEKNENTGIAASLLLHEDKTPHALQGTGRLTPITAVFAYSFLTKLFPNNSFSKKFWSPGWDKNKTKEFAVVPLSASMIKKELFNKINGFDKNIFLYFEEYDFSERLKKFGVRNYIVSSSQAIHLWGRSTEDKIAAYHVYKKSLFYYLKKHFGTLVAWVIVWFLSLRLRKAVK